VAVKQLFPHLAEQKIYLDMFLEEARIGAVLSDPNIARVFDFLAYGGNYYLVLEWVEGVDLFTYIEYTMKKKKRPPRWELMAAVMIGMLRGLAAAHERLDENGAPQPIIHRDVTPHNVLISVQGTARLIDFGLGLARDRTDEDTDPGIAKGKFSYLAPEVVGGKRPTPAADQFAAGALLWEALTGRRLFQGDGAHEILKKVMRCDVPSIRRQRSGLPRGLADVVHKALSPDPNDRYPSVREMANRLSAVLATSSKTADTYATLGKTVKEARIQLGLGHRPQDGRGETPVPIPLEDSDVHTITPDVVERTGLRSLLPALLRPFKRS